MSRNIPDEVLQDLYSLNSTSIEFLLLRIFYNNQTLYLVNNFKDITYNSQVYTALPFKVTLPDDKDQEDEGAKLQIADINGEIFTIVRTVDELSAEFEIITKRSDNSMISLQEYKYFKLSTVSWDSSQVTFTLTSDDALVYSFPKDTMDNYTFKGMY